MNLLSEIVGQKGAYFLLNELYTKNKIINTNELTNLIEEVNVSDELFSELTRSGLFNETPKGFYISTLGEKITLLLKAINNEEEISNVFQQLTFLYPSLRPYELITESITDYFIDTVYKRPDFIRLYICSPWIRLDNEHIEKIQNSIFTAQKRYKNVQILIITLPLERYRDAKATKTLKLLRQLGADIVINSRLHTKLYMSEPGPCGGNYFAILGSENLTGRRNIELAIKIQNDNNCLRKLNLYFYDIWQKSKILKEV